MIKIPGKVLALISTQHGAPQRRFRAAGVLVAIMAASGCGGTTTDSVSRSVVKAASEPGAIATTSSSPSRSATAGAAPSHAAKLPVRPRAATPAASRTSAAARTSGVTTSAAARTTRVGSAASQPAPAIVPAPSASTRGTAPGPSPAPPSSTTPTHSPAPTGYTPADCQGSVVASAHVSFSKGFVVLTGQVVNETGIPVYVENLPVVTVWSSTNEHVMLFGDYGTPPQPYGGGRTYADLGPGKSAAFHSASMQLTDFARADAAWPPSAHIGDYSIVQLCGTRDVTNFVVFQ